MSHLGARILLAPMEGLLDHTLRDMLTRVGGVDLCVSEFIRVTNTVLPRRAFIRVAPELLNQSRTVAGVPVRVQLLGSDPDMLAANAAALAAQVDYLVVAVPGGEDTQHMINADVLKALGNKGFVINIARGSVIDQPALIEALKNKTIAGAGLDVFWDEPKVDAELRKLQNVVLTPHIGSNTHETRRAMADLALANLKAFFNKQPLLTPVPECLQP